jgi:hypothetical protein
VLWEPVTRTAPRCNAFLLATPFLLDLSPLSPSLPCFATTCLFFPYSHPCWFALSAYRRGMLKLSYRLSQATPHLVCSARRALPLTMTRAQGNYSKLLVGLSLDLRCLSSVNQSLSPPGLQFNSYRKLQDMGFIHAHVRSRHESTIYSILADPVSVPVPREYSR